MLGLEGVERRFANGIVALRDCSFAVAGGEILALLGPSGCGKSTVLRLIAGLEQPDAGRLVWAAGRPEIAYVFQDATLMPWASVAANVALPLRLRGVAKGERLARAAEAIERVGLAGFATARPAELSGGMRMRVSIARAFVARPAVLLMDEPFAALDEITRLKLDDELRRHARDLKLTVVFVTHSVFESVYLADRILVLSPRPGRVVAEHPIAGGADRGPAFRAAPGYAAQCGAVSASLARAMGERP